MFNKQNGLSCTSRLSQRCIFTKLTEVNLHSVYELDYDSIIINQCLVGKNSVISGL